MRYRRNRDLLNVDYPLLLNYEVSLYVMSLFVFSERDPCSEPLRQIGAVAHTHIGKWSDRTLLAGSPVNSI